MKKTGLWLVLALLLSCSQQPGTPPYDLVISRVNLIDGTGRPLRAGVSIGVRDGRIAAIQKGELTARKTIDGSGKFLMPGLFDGHVHTTDYRADFPRFVHYGVTSVFITGGSRCSNDLYAAMREMGDQDSIPAPRVFHTSQHFTLEGRHPVKTYPSPNWVDGETVFFLKDTSQIEVLVDQVAAYPIAGIKLTIEDGPAPPIVERMPQVFINKIVREAARHGLPVFAHASDNTEFLMAVRGGVRHLVHYVGIDLDWEDPEHLAAVDTIKAREGSWVTTLVLDKSFLYPLHPEWLASAGLNELYPVEALKAMLTPERVAQAREIEQFWRSEYGFEVVTPENIFAFQVDDVKKLYERGINMVLGTDVGNDFIFPGYSIHEEMAILAQGGMAPPDIIKMATLNGARMVEADSLLGSIEVGKMADLVLLKANPLDDIGNTQTIQTVIKNGVVQR